MTYKYICEATLGIDTQTYVKREADEQLYEELKKGKFCYVFNSRKTGKSSLRVQVMNRLKQEGIACVEIDVSAKGTQLTTPEKWYNSILLNLNRKLSLDVNLKNWLSEFDWLSPQDRLAEFIDSILLKRISQNIVIFIDEIDSILSLKFPSDDFFAYIRACHNQGQSGENPAYQRLTFCLLGVATPSDLIQDKKRTPFNIGQAIELKGFTKEQAAPLAKGLEGKIDRPIHVLNEILDWTGGQPFLTQKLCKIVLERSQTCNPDIAELVQAYIINSWEENDNPEHLGTIRDRILSNQQRTSQLLGIYQQIITPPNPPLPRGGTDSILTPPLTKGGLGGVAADNSPDQMELQLSGLVVKRNGYLQVYNRIYATIFDLDWVQQELAKLRPYQENFAAWIASKREDTSRLLHGQALDDALQWKVGKRLSDEDNDFLDASQADERQELRTSNKLLKETRRQVREVLKIEEAGYDALKLFQLGGKQIAALRAAIKAGEDLKKWIPDNPPLSEYPTTSPLLALQVILTKIREKRQFVGHNGGINSVSFSPNGDAIATASDDKSAKLWDLQGNCLLTFIGHNDSVNSVSFSPTENVLITASDDRTAKLWDLRGDCLQTFTRHRDWVTSVSFSPTQNAIATTSRDNTAKLWDFQGNCLLTFTKHNDSVTSVSFSPTQDTLATTSRDNTGKLWDLHGNCLVTFAGHTRLVNSVSFSPNGDAIATASSDTTAKLWDLQGNCLLTFTGHNDSVTSVSFSPKGNAIATASKDDTAKLWDLQGNCLVTFTGHKESVNTVSFSPNGNAIATASKDGSAKLWDLQGNCLVTFTGYNRLVRNSINRSTQLVDNLFVIFKAYEVPITSISYNPTQDLLATASTNGTIKLWDSQGNCLVAFTLTRQNYRANSVIFSPNGDAIATASQDKTAKLWDLQGNCLVTFIGHNDSVNSVSFSPNGEIIATASFDKTAKLWDLQGNCLVTFTGHNDRVNSVCFSHTVDTIATASQDGTAKLWDLQGNCLTVFTGHNDSVNSVSFSPTGDAIATASSDKTAKLWDLQGKFLVTFAEHNDSITSVSFSPTGDKIATASIDGTAKLWDLQGNLLADFNGYQGNLLKGEADFVKLKIPIYSICFSRDGKFLITGSQDGKVLFWPVETLDELLARGREWLGEKF
ncbi:MULTISPECIES: AAA-like domain-containing protein [unclassified Microcoleus]|uniref:WD40 domain-containing protein n=1 Tax=unclassified Microcoleus TaxID=2642155 RepID=UPI0025F2BBDC|nr:MULTISPECIES: AAA-like domain-containing protein [unclassified Microcoleus]